MNKTSAPDAEAGHTFPPPKYDDVPPPTYSQAVNPAFVRVSEGGQQQVIRTRPPPPTLSSTVSQEEYFSNYPTFVSQTTHRQRTHRVMDEGTSHYYTHGRATAVRLVALILLLCISITIVIFL